MTEAPGTNTVVSLDDVLRALRRRWTVIVACTLLALGAALALSLTQAKQYTAASYLYFNNSQTDQQVAGIQAVSNSDPQGTQDTNVQLVQLGRTAAQTAAEVGNGLTAKGVRNRLLVTSISDTSVVKLTVVGRTPAIAARIANTYATLFVQNQSVISQSIYSSALNVVTRQLDRMSKLEREGVEGQTLQERAASLAVLAEAGGNTVQVAQRALPPNGPSSPKTTRNAVLGFLLGLVVGITACLLLYVLDRRIAEPAELEKIYEKPLLGVIPQDTSYAAESGQNLGSLAGQHEVFQLLRAHLRYFNVDRDLKTLLVTSGAPGEGKTTVALQLAGAAARVGDSVLLLELDLRRPTLARRLGVTDELGVASVLLGTTDLDAAIQSVQLSANTGNGGGAFDVLVAGVTAPPNPTELLESDATTSLIAECVRRYGLVIVDTPPITVVPDAIPLLRKVDGVLVVGRIGHSRRDVAKRLYDTLTAANAPFLGVVANAVDPPRLSAYSYGYGYDYRSTERADKAAGATAEAAADLSDEKHNVPELGSTETEAKAAGPVLVIEDPSAKEAATSDNNDEPVAVEELAEPGSNNDENAADENSSADADVSATSD